MSICRLLVPALAAAALAGAAPAAPAIEGGRGLFASYRTLTVELKAPLDDLFANARDDNGYAVTGTLSYNTDDGRRGAIDEVKVSLRGHTSRRESECPFPKLKLTWAATDHAPLFAGRSAVKVGTHCDEKQDGLTAKFGRLPNERAPWREAFVYRLLDTLGVPVLKARPARITYVFTDEGGAESSRQLVRNGFLLEDDKDARRRFGAEREIDEADFTTAADTFAPADTARLALAQALIGNFDWCVRMFAGDRYRCDARHPLWNVLALAGRDRVTPVLYDFDVSGMVAGSHLWFRDVYNEAFMPSKSRAAVEVLAQVQRTRSLFPRSVLDAARTGFIERRAAAYAALKDAPLDDEGRTAIAGYLDSFFDAIGSDDAFYRPVVIASDTVAWSDADRSSRACGARSVVPVGTPVSEPVESRGRAVRVMLLDVFWRWAPPNACDAVHRAAVWIDGGAISSSYPK